MTTQSTTLDDSAEGETGSSRYSGRAVSHGLAASAVRRWRHLDRRGLLATLLVLAWPAVEAARIIIEPVHETLFGDYAFFELQVREAIRLHLLLGTSVSAGFNEPGPAASYLLAPTVRLLGSGPGLYLGVVVINAAALLAIVLLAWRVAGARVALWTAAAANLFCLSLGLNTLRQPWPPFLVFVPMLLFVLLAAAAVARVEGAWVWAAVVGSYELQTYVSTAIFVPVCLVVAGAWAAVTWRPRSLRPGQGTAWRRAPLISGLCALVLIWLPSTIELFVDHPNNWSKTWEYLHHGHNIGYGMNLSFGVVLQSVASFPFEHRIWTAEPFPGGQQVAGLVIALFAVFLVVWCVRRGQRFAAALAAFTVLAVPMATLTVTHATGTFYNFVTGWLSFSPYALLLVVAMMFMSTPRPRPGNAPGKGVAIPAGSSSAPDSSGSSGSAASLSAQATLVIGLVVAVASASLAVFSDLRQPSIATGIRQLAANAPFASRAEAHLLPSDHSVGVIIASYQVDTVAANLVLELQRRGYTTLVDPRFAYVFGKALTTWHRVPDVYFNFSAADPRSAAGIAGTPIADFDGIVLKVWRPGRSGGAGAIGAPAGIAPVGGG